MRPDERLREFLIADLALDLELATAVDVGAALSRFLTEGGSFLEQLTKTVDLSDDQVQRLTREAEARAPPLFPDRYRDFEPIGEGGMGIVYLALDTQLNRKVAIKIIRPLTKQGAGTPTPLEIEPPSSGSQDEDSYEELVGRFQQEAWLTGALEHPGIVPVYEFGRTPRGVPYYTMRYVKGVRTLESDLKKAKTLDDRLTLLDSFLKVCDAIRYAHSHGVIHRDLKPANIGLGEFGEVVVLDWGLAKMRESPDRVESVWQERIRDLRETRDMQTVAAALGTPGYMSPEAAMGDLSDVDERSDVYSLGVVLYKILTGRLPFEFESYWDLLHKLREETPSPPSAIERAVPTDLSQICAKALAREKRKRFAGAGLLASAIRTYQRESAIRSEVRGLISEAQTAYEGTRNLAGESLLKQIDRVTALCQRVLQHQKGHTRARALLKNCENMRRRAIKERERAIEEEAHERRLALIRHEKARRERLFSRVALVGLFVIAVATGVVAMLLNAKREDALRAREEVLHARAETAAVGASRELSERATRDVKAEVARLGAELETEKAATKAATASAGRLRSDLNSEMTKVHQARAAAEAARADRDQAAVERNLALEELAGAKAETARLQAALEAATQVRRTRTKEWLPRLLDLAREYMQKTLPEEKDRILEQARKLRKIRRSELQTVIEKLFDVARSGPKCEDKEDCTANYPPFPGTYTLTKVRGRKFGVLVGLPQAGTRTAHKVAAEFWRGALGTGLLGVFPEGSEGVLPVAVKGMDGLVLAILRELKRTYRIDTNRIYIAGYEDSGGEAYLIGSRHADVFAAVSANEGLVSQEDFARSAPNLHNTPVFLTHFQASRGAEEFRRVAGGLEDLRLEYPKGYPCKYIEGEGNPATRTKAPYRGLTVPGGSVREVARWLRSHQRDPYPKRVVWQPHSEEGFAPKRCFFWLRKAEASGGRIVATISSNRVEVECVSTKGLSILLADQMFDIGRPVTVVVNGKTAYEDIPTPDPAALMESILDNIDPEQVFTCRIDL